MSELKEQGKNIHISKLEYRDVLGAGKEIYAHIDQEVPCVEFTMKKDVFQRVTHKCDAPYIVFTEPFVQFSPQSWDDMIENLFTELVELWNQKHGR